MRAILCTRYGTPDDLVLGEIDRPSLGAGELRLRVGAAGVNFPDLLILQGKYQVRAEPPFVPGFEVAGTVIEIGADVTERRVGDRVMALTALGYGAFAEEAIVRATESVPVPDDVDDATATALYTAYGTAYHALVDRGRLRAGETLVVLGATGGVGLAAVEVGVALGARVIAVARSEEKLALARGATARIAYRPGELGAAVRAIAPAGADVCIDLVGGSAFDEMARTMAWDGRLLVVGFTSGVVPKLPVNLALLKGYALVGVYWGAFVTRDPAANAANFRALAVLLREGKIAPHVGGRYPLARVPEALNDLASRGTAGKLVITIGG